MNETVKNILMQYLFAYDREYLLSCQSREWIDRED